jgi:hypothetical protein
MVHGKSMVVTDVQPIAKTQTITIDVNVVDFNVTTRSREPRKSKSVIDLEKEERLKKSMVETI